MKRHKQSGRPPLEDESKRHIKLSITLPRWMRDRLFEENDNVSQAIELALMKVLK